MSPKRLTKVDQALQPLSAPVQSESSIRPEQVTAAKALLVETGRRLRDLLQDEAMMTETPLEVQNAMESATDSLEAAIGQLKSIAAGKAATASFPGGPTRQQGQFLAFIHEYIMRNANGVAPSHADLQRYFDLTPPSVNSMLIRLEQKGFIRRIPHTARAIEIIIRPEYLPPLDRPFKF